MILACEQAVTGVPDLAAWLREAITERLELARKATQAPWEPEGDDPTDDEVYIDVDGEPWRVLVCRGPDSHANMLHVAANDPADVIARCEAELAILAEHGLIWRDIGFGTDDGEEYEEIPVCGSCVPKHSHFRSRGAVPEGPCRTVRLLGSGYRARDGYQQEWAP